MRPATKLFLLAGCGLVLLLEAPASFSAFSAGWRGPYAGRAWTERTAAGPDLGAPPLRTAASRPSARSGEDEELARR